MFKYLLARRKTAFENNSPVEIFKHKELGNNGRKDIRVRFKEAILRCELSSVNCYTESLI